MSLSELKSSNCFSSSSWPFLSVTVAPLPPAELPLSLLFVECAADWNSFSTAFPAEASPSREGGADSLVMFVLCAVSLTELWLASCPWSFVSSSSVQAAGWTSLELHPSKSESWCSCVLRRLTERKICIVITSDEMTNEHQSSRRKKLEKKFENHPQKALFLSSLPGFIWSEKVMIYNFAA